MKIFLLILLGIVIAIVLHFILVTLAILIKTIKNFGFNLYSRGRRLH